MIRAITNREFRDWSKEGVYPFADTARLVNDQGIEIRPEVFIDALIYSLEDVEQPFYISSLDGTKGGATGMGVTIKDNNNRVVCTGTINYEEDTCYLFDPSGRTAGSLVYNTDHMEALVGRVGILEHLFTKTQTPFLVSRGFVTRSSGLSTVSSAVGTVSEEVYLVAANGVHFTLDGDDVYVNLVGEESLTDRPVKSINGISLKHFWFAAHPNSDIKIVTGSNGITIWKITDDN
jgi:hypothetical protein